MKQIINQNIQPVIYRNKDYPLTFAHVINQSSILNSINSSNNIISENSNYCLPKGLNISIQGPATSSAIPVLSMSRNGGNLVTVTSNNHGLSAGASIVVSGATPNIYNGSYTIVSITGVNTFTYQVSSNGTDSATGSFSVGVVKNTISYVAIQPDRLVWIIGKGAYITKEAAWVFVPEITNIINNSNKIYSVDKNGSYIVFDTKDLTDPFNQLKQLNIEEGYIVVSNKNGQIPNYLWYETSEQIAKKSSDAEALFVYKQCSTSVNVTNNQKVIKLSDIEGNCDSYKKAGASLKIKAHHLKKGHNYLLTFDTDHKNLVFENDQLYYGNNQLTEITITNNIDILSDLINNIVTINLHLYENDILINNDSISVYINCPPPPVTIVPPLVKPRFYLIGD